jgi:integrase
MSSISDQFSEKEIQEADTTTSVDEVAVKSRAISEFIEDKLERGRQGRMVQRHEAILREFEAFVYWTDQAHVCMIDDGHVVEFNDHLKHSDHYLTRTGPNVDGTDELNLSDMTRHGFLSTLVTFYKFLEEKKGVISNNPAQQALRSFPEDEFDLTPPDRPRIEMDEMREFLEWLDTSFERAIILTLLKTGVRIGELVNIDLRCVHLGDGTGNIHPLYNRLLDRYDVDLISEVRSKPDTMFVYTKFNEETEIRDEIRKSGNKRKDKQGSVIPIDDELKTALLEYLLTRRPPLEHDRRDTAIPLFTKPSNYGTLDRLTYSSVKSQFGEGSTDNDGVLAEYGWYEEGADTEENVFMHYFRHYFTDNHKHNHGVYRGWMPAGVIAYIRGDVDKSATVGSERRESTARENTYSHDDWRNYKINIEQPYLDNIYKFGLYDQTAPRREPQGVVNR